MSAENCEWPGCGFTNDARFGIDDTPEKLQLKLLELSFRQLSVK